MSASDGHKSEKSNSEECCGMAEQLRLRRVRKAVECFVVGGDGPSGAENATERQPLHSPSRYFEDTEMRDELANSLMSSLSIRLRDSKVCRFSAAHVDLAVVPEPTNPIFNV